MLILLGIDMIAIIVTIILSFVRLFNTDWLLFGFVLASIILSSLLVFLSYFAFASVAKDRDRYKEENEMLKSVSIEAKPLILTLYKWAIGLSSMTDYPKEPENAYWLRLEVIVNPTKPIDTVDLVIGKDTIPVNDWPGKIVTSFTAYFYVTKWREKGKNPVELKAYIGDKMYRSGRKTIDFNVEPGGLGRLF